MEKKQKLIIAGVVGGLLFLIAIYVNFFTGGTSTPQEAVDNATKVTQEIETQTQAQPQEPPQIAPDDPGARVGKQPRNPS